MKIKGASAYLAYVQDLNKTAEFYEKLGLVVHEQTDTRVVIYINWYRIDFVKVSDVDYPQFKAEAESDTKGSGVFFYFSVDDVDEAYREVKAAGLEPATEPKSTGWGTYEFVLVDPDGYKLVFFTRKAKRNPQN